jgi:hypothetical protein
MFGLARHWRGSIELASWVFQLESFEEMPALVALITSGILVVTQRTCAFNETIRQEAFMCLTVRLCGRLLLQVAVFVQLFENVLSNVCLVLGRCAAKMIEADVEPFVDLRV